MKNKMVKALSIMMSLCMLGGSGVQAAEFSSGTETVNEVPETSETVEFAEEQLVLRYGMIQMEKLMHLLQVLVQEEQLQVLVNILSLRMTRLR